MTLKRAKEAFPFQMIEQSLGAWPLSRMLLHAGRDVSSTEKKAKVP